MSTDRGGDLIIRRKVAELAEPHKGGVWKIAHADFMTAMMAFFLVMWLVNAADDSVRRGVARYFNPIQLADSMPESRGLEDPSSQGGSADERRFEAGASPDPQSGFPNTTTTKTEGAFPEVKLFADPFAALDAIAAAEEMQASSAPSSAADKAGDDKPGDSFRDPFDPLSWSRPSATPVPLRPAPSGAATETATAAGASGGTAETPAKAPADKAAVGGSADTPSPMPGDKVATAGPALTQAEQTANRLADGGRSEAAAEAPGDKVATAGPAPKAADGAQSGRPVAGSVDARTQTSAPDGRLETSAAKRGETPAAEQQAAEQQAAEQQAGAMAADGKASAEASDPPANVTALTAALKAAGPPIGSFEVAVRTDPEGVLIQLSDKERAGMFAVGSAEPSPVLVGFAAKIGKILSETPGRVIVRGHTDGRPYRSADYDNWRLSTARAHMAAYMLERGGLSDARIDRVEGHADRDLLVPEDPLASSNRRIEILIKRGDAP